MKLTSHSFDSDVPPEKICQPSVDYQVFETDMTAAAALTSFDRLIRPRDCICLETPACRLDFWKHEGAISAEVTSAEFWATSKISLAEAQAIIETLDRGGDFTSRIPASNREWDTYAFLGKDVPAEIAAI
jgi:hypothetical protein